MPNMVLGVEEWYPVYIMYDVFKGNADLAINVPSELITEYNEVMARFEVIQRKLKGFYEANE